MSLLVDCVARKYWLPKVHWTQRCLRSSLRSDGLGRLKPVISTPPHATSTALGLATVGAGAVLGVLRGGNDRRDQVAL